MFSCVPDGRPPLPLSGSNFSPLRSGWRIQVVDRVVGTIHGRLLARAPAYDDVARTFLMFYAAHFRGFVHHLAGISGDAANLLEER